MIDIYKTHLQILLIKLQRLTMRQRVKKIVLVEQMLPYPSQTHNFIQHDEDSIHMKIYSEEKKHFGELAQIFYQAIVTEPLVNNSINMPKNQDASLLVLKDKNIKKNLDTPEFTKKLQQKGFQQLSFIKMPIKSEKNQSSPHKKSSSTKIERNQQSFLSYRSVSFSSDKKQHSSRYFNTQKQCQSARKSNSIDKENHISEFVCSSASAKKMVKTIKYSVLPFKRMI